MTNDYFPSPDQMSTHTICPGVTIRTAACQKMMLSMAELQARAVVPAHSHPHEQVGIVLEGRARFLIGGQEKTLGPGDLFRIPGNVSHEVIVLDQPTRVLDIFQPVREEYR